ncbi:hypothetical protein FKP32DRAFT_1605530 [Trametes sanguinea]|nr:hypothetical protein FKP32DRAFT_1605530 [Trametes sanguinea]
MILTRNSYCKHLITTETEIVLLGSVPTLLHPAATCAYTQRDLEKAKMTLVHWRRDYVLMVGECPLPLERSPVTGQIMLPAASLSSANFNAAQSDLGSNADNWGVMKQCHPLLGSEVTPAARTRALGLQEAYTMLVPSSLTRRLVTEVRELSERRCVGCREKFVRLSHIFEHHEHTVGKLWFSATVSTWDVVSSAFYYPGGSTLSFRYMGL